MTPAVSSPAGRHWRHSSGRVDVVPANFRPFRPPFRDRGSDFPASARRDRPPEPSPPSPAFLVELLRDRSGPSETDIEALIEKCEPAPEKKLVFWSGRVAGWLAYTQWVEAREAMVSLWGLRLKGAHNFLLDVTSPVLLPSDIAELRDELKTLFLGHVRGLIDGEEVKQWRRKLDSIADELAKVSMLLKKRRKQIVRCEWLLNKNKGLELERGLIEKRISEFRSAMGCILAHIEGKQPEEGNGEGLEVLKLRGNLNWARIHCLIDRELRRLQNGLPIYAYRREILQQILSQQITVLTGETGSGKSTQLVQFLADSGVGADESIICTQPRKIAANSLARRVAEESNGCHGDNLIIYCPTCSSFQPCVSKVIYMTDHCLLQHYVTVRNLSGISCFIIDEAHERSLNTDLLLALLKKLLIQNHELRLIVMSATADASQISDYFFRCKTFHVVGRSFPVDVIYAPTASAGMSGSGAVGSHVSNVLKTVIEIHKTMEEGTILAFLTSQMEVEWACENFRCTDAVSLPLHGKLSNEEQLRVFQNTPGKRKVIFATNIAETSLTIPGVKYVVDSGMVKESRFEPKSGINVLRVCRTNKSSANQRAGRAGRTEAGRCYRIYSERDYESMLPHPEPEILRVHLGVAVLRILAIGVNNVNDFDFIDAPSGESIDMAIRNLIQLGAVTLKNEALELTEEGHYFVKMGIEPRLGKLILGCFYHQLGREGLVLAAVMANSSSIFCRVGNNETKLKSDCLKVQFCHRNGDLFTLLSVYKEWEELPLEKRNKWCWENSINAKSMRRCQETVVELEHCLQNEVRIIIPSYWRWNPHQVTENDKILKKVILSSLAENVAMYSGHDRLGYEVALTEQNVQLHPSCSLLMFSQKPQWVVFGDIVSTSNQYLVCVTAIDLESLSTLCPPPPYDVSIIQNRKLQVMVMAGFGSSLLKRFCGKYNDYLLRFVSRVQTACMDKSINVEVNFDQHEILVYAPSQDLERAVGFVNDALEYERKWLQNECLEKCLYHGGFGGSSVALFGAGAQIKHLELENRCLTVDIFYSASSSVDDKELLIYFDKYTSGNICNSHKLTVTGQDTVGKEKSSRITFLSPEAAKKAAELNEFEFNGTAVRARPSCMNRVDRKLFSFPTVKAKVYWPRRRSKGRATIRCHPSDVNFMIDELSRLFYVCIADPKFSDRVEISGLDKDLSETEILNSFEAATSSRILDFWLWRGAAVENPPCEICEKALLREISPFMRSRNSIGNCCHVQVFEPYPRDCFMKGIITFDARLHLEAAKALEQIQGKVLPGLMSWQKLKCQQFFRSSVSCPASVYRVIKNELQSFLAKFKRQDGVEIQETYENGTFRVNICASATKTVAELRKPLEELMRGKRISDASLTPTILKLLYTRDGIMLKNSIQQQTGTFILDRHSSDIRVFGPPRRVDDALNRLTQCLLNLQESKEHEIRLQGGDLPPDLMKRVVKTVGPELQGLKDKVGIPGVYLNTRRHVISVHGNTEVKAKVEEMVYEIAGMHGESDDRRSAESTSCPICFCDLVDCYKLEDCGHSFCKSCLVEQCESAIRSQDSFPICCINDGCKAPILITDLRSLLSCDQLEELFRASLAAFVASSNGMYKFCPSPDCPAVYRVADPGVSGEPFSCGACYVETCTSCHLEYHPYLSCEMYREIKDNPDLSLDLWRKGREHVKHCPGCGYIIEKVDGCNHVVCRCGKHICWNCLASYSSSNECYDHLRSVHQAIS